MLVPHPTHWLISTQVDRSRWHVVLVRDAVATQESILRRFWKFRDLDGGRVDTLHREETFYAKAVARLEKAIKNLDCRRTFFLSYDLAARHPQAHASPLHNFWVLRRWASFEVATTRPSTA